MRLPSLYFSCEPWAAVKPDAATRQALADWYDADALRYQLRDLSDEEFLAALQQLAGAPPGN